MPIAEINPDNWNNIPFPLVDWIKSIIFDSIQKDKTFANHVGKFDSFVEKTEFQRNRMETEFNRVEELNDAKFSRYEKQMNNLFNNQRKQFENSLAILRKDFENFQLDTSGTFNEIKSKLIKMEAFDKVKSHIEERLDENKNLIHQRIIAEVDDLKDFTKHSIKKAFIVDGLIGLNDPFKSFAEFWNSSHESILAIPYIEDKLETKFFKEIESMRSIVDTRLDNLKPEITKETETKIENQGRLIIQTLKI